jgi:hypothetical protein
MRRWFAFLFLGSLLAQSSPEHVTVYSQKGRYAGWPANHGIWSWGDEILVGFESGAFRVNDRGMHAIDYNSPEEHLLARSLDGGRTWKVEKPSGLIPPPGTQMAGVPVEEGGRPVTDCQATNGFDQAGFLFTFRMESFHTGPARYYFSRDKGKTWSGPCRLPDFETKGIAARTDYLVEGPRQAIAFLTAAKPNAREGRPFAARTKDGGQTWQFVSWIGPEPAGFSIMPSSVRLSPTEIVTAVRRQEKGEAWIELWRSTDNAATWSLSSEVTAVRTRNAGNPPSLVKLRDGRVAVTYGHREAPFGIRARVSSDGGRTWAPEIVLRADGGGRDLGYTRTVQRKDGALVTVYYYNLNESAERTIEATIWRP